MTDGEIACADLPSAAYPFTIDFYRVDDLDGKEPVHTIHVTGPGVVEVPALSTRVGSPVWTRIRYANGKIDVAWPEEGEGIVP